LVLLAIDFIKGEIEKIENDMEPDGDSEALAQKASSILKTMNEINSEFVEHNSKNQMDNSNSYKSSYQNLNIDDEQRYIARIFFEDECDMENIRAYTVVHNLKGIASEIYHIPEDIIDNKESANEIRKNGFFIGFSTYEKREKIQEQLEETVLLKEFELLQVQEYPPDLNALKEKSEVVHNETIEVMRSNKEEATNMNKSGKHQSIISVNISKLDMLLDLVGEIVISEAMVVKNPDLEGLQLDNFNKASLQLRKLTNELQDIVMSIRMVEVSMTFRKMNRIVRDMSKKLNKLVELKIIGEETEVDKNIIDHISDPLMHLVRNSLDHGLEGKEERIDSGKPEVGKITLEAKNVGGDVFIIVSDDGRGLDRKKIYDKARDKGLTTKVEEELTDSEIFSFILLPGFSTNERVTEYSGRGVGMDVVKKNIDSIGGTIFIESIPGKGSKTSVKIPLTLAIIDGLEVLVGKARYTIPITNIRESFKPDENGVIIDSDENELIMIRGEAYPVFRVSRIFNINTKITTLSDGIIVVVEHNKKVACLFVDSLIGEQQVVVKALPGYVKKAKGIAGCTILGDGSMSLILDVSGILDR